VLDAGLRTKSSPPDQPPTGCPPSRSSSSCAPRSAYELRPARRRRGARPGCPRSRASPQHRSLRVVGHVPGTGVGRLREPARGWRCTAVHGHLLQRSSATGANVRLPAFPDGGGRDIRRRYRRPRRSRVRYSVYVLVCRGSGSEELSESSSPTKFGECRAVRSAPMTMATWFGATPSISAIASRSADEPVAGPVGHGPVEDLFESIGCELRQQLAPRPPGSGAGGEVELDRWCREPVLVEPSIQQELGDLHRSGLPPLGAVDGRRGGWNPAAPTRRVPSADLWPGPGDGVTVLKVNGSPQKGHVTAGSTMLPQA
jgi:hypothetical protein